jgi:hypothetical protein
MTAVRLPPLGPFVAKLEDKPGFEGTTKEPGVQVSNESGSFSVRFPRTPGMLKLLDGCEFIYREAELMNGIVLVIGPEAEAWGEQSYFEKEELVR